MTFQTLLGLLRLTTLPMGATNSVQILQGDISFIIQHEMPDIAAAFMDDVNVRGPPTWYATNSAGWYISTAFVEPLTKSAPILCILASDQPCFGSDYQHISLDDQHYEVIPENTGLCRFIWEHLNDINRVLQHVKKAGGTFSGWKMDVCVPEIGRA